MIVFVFTNSYCW